MTSTHISMLLLIAFSFWRDKEALREGGPLSRYVFYTLMAASFLILIYTSWESAPFNPAEWLGRMLAPIAHFTKP
ncbi:hypothetical protein M0651_13445 [Paenibacillus sp. MBLB2552]|uniref:Uncharacterized protein n=1 Tax=Paenibacillus mellifer TaxID=2937794 RepID=A0A9X2BSA3_9BACL|nr:hypothetical protein [Paenibacillus mellifer]MCK8488180.1 hypothetical protein [Paenibacillus mellifer]